MLAGAMQQFRPISKGVQRLVHAFHHVALGVTGAVVNMHGYVCKMLQGIDRVNKGRGIRSRIAASAAAVAASVSAEEPVGSHRGHRLSDCRF